MGDKPAVPYLAEPGQAFFQVSLGHGIVALPLRQHARAIERLGASLGIRLPLWQREDRPKLPRWYAIRPGLPRPLAVLVRVGVLLLVVTGVIFVAAYLGNPFSPIAHIADHIEHVARVGGEDCVALGSDYDGFAPLARGMRDAADLPRLTQVLWDRGWREPALTKLLGENARRYFTANW